MKRITTMLGAGVLLLGMATPTFSQPAPGSISPHHDTGQQVGGEDGLECDEGTPPGGSGDVHGNPDNVGSPFVEGDSVSGAHYAGEQPQNQKNTAAVSQYDIGCFGGSPRPNG